MLVVSSELQTANPQGYLLPDRFFAQGNMPYPSTKVGVSSQSCVSGLTQGRTNYSQMKVYATPFADLVNIYMGTQYRDLGGFKWSYLKYACAGFGIPMLSYYAMRRLNINVKQRCFIGMAAAAVCAAWACRRIYTGSGPSEYAVNEMISFHKDRFKSWLGMDDWESNSDSIQSSWRNQSGKLFKTGSASSVATDNTFALEAYLGVKNVVLGSWSSPGQTDTDFAQAFDNAYVRRLKKRNRQNGAVLLAGSAAAAGCLWLLMVENSRLFK